MLMELPEFKYKIGDKLRLKGDFQTPYYMMKRVYVVDDIMYSMNDKCWFMVLYYYVNSIDEGTSMVEVEQVYKEFEKIED
jgi:hypothetical protein